MYRKGFTELCVTGVYQLRSWLYSTQVPY